MKQVGGFWWPDEESVCTTLLLDEVEDLDVAISYCRNTRTVIQAGGNVGVYPVYLSDTFDKVRTFEPSQGNFDLLLLNTGAIRNIRVVGCALGEKIKRAGIYGYKSNCGGSYLGDGTDVSVVSIDSLGLKDVDLIQLDVEGYERHALNGAANTIEECQPVIMVENRGHDKRYGSTKLIDWISDTFGYEAVRFIHYDVILVPKDIK